MEQMTAEDWIILRLLQVMRKKAQPLFYDGEVIQSVEYIVHKYGLDVFCDAVQALHAERKLNESK